MNQIQNSRMPQNMREFFVSRIRSGFIKLDDIYVYGADPFVEYEAAERYNTVLEEALYEGAPTELEHNDLMIDIGLWSLKNEETLEKILPEHIEQWKVQIFQATFKSLTKETFREYLRTAEAEQTKLFSIKHLYDSYTAEGIANFAKNIHIFMNSTFDRSGNPIDWNELDPVSYLYKYNEKILNQSSIRELARNNPWSLYWNLNKKVGTHQKLFFSKYLNIEQCIISQWSTLYDNIHDSPDSPNDEVIDDDDALDGWLILNRKKRDGDKNKSLVDSLSAKVGNASEIFMMAETPEDAKKIKGLNDQRANSIVNSRIKQVKEKGIVHDHQFKDQQEKLMMEVNQMNSSSIKAARG